MKGRHIQGCSTFELPPDLENSPLNAMDQVLPPCGDSGSARIAPNRPVFKSFPLLLLPVWPTQTVSFLISKMDPRKATLLRLQR